MLDVCPKDICTGCSACVSLCTEQCITMQQDEEGFFSPQIDPMRCTACNVCKRACPAQSDAPSTRKQPKVYACWNRNDAIRFQSASGGVFSALADSVLSDNGIVYGAAFDERMHLRHIGVEDKKDLWRLRSSKYVQSDVASVFTQVRWYLEQGRTILFTGTPCQISALLTLTGNHTKLLTCDLICHGVPSPGFFSKYKEFLEAKYGSKLTGINFRHKCNGWMNQTTVAEFSDFSRHHISGLDNAYLLAFAHSLSLRRSCYTCTYASVFRRGDVTLADFWKVGEIHPFSQDVRLGISLVLVNTEKGESFLMSRSDELFMEQRTVEEAVYGQSHLTTPAVEPGNRGDFFADCRRLTFEMLAYKYFRKRGWKELVRPLVPPKLLSFVRRSIATAIPRKSSG